jgi:hypothetical protein
VAAFKVTLILAQTVISRATKIPPFLVKGTKFNKLNTQLIPVAKDNPISKLRPIPPSGSRRNSDPRDTQKLTATTKIKRTALIYELQEGFQIEVFATQPP